MKTELKLGQIITEPQQRDAIHIAVAPMQSTQTLYPGQHVGLENGMANTTGNAIGVVDPFLKHPVMPGQQFWLFLYPQTVTGMRHEWTHPAFDNTPSVASQPFSAASLRWLQEFAQEYDITYNALIEAAATWIRSGEYYCFRNGRSSQFVPDEFWPHYEAVTGSKVSENNKSNFFTCSC